MEYVGLSDHEIWIWFFDKNVPDCPRHWQFSGIDSERGLYDLILIAIVGITIHLSSKVLNPFPLDLIFRFVIASNLNCLIFVVDW